MSVKKETLIVRKIREHMNKKDKSYFFKIHGGPMQMVGISDLIGVYNGRFVAIEVKVPGKEKNVTKLQQYFLDKVNDCGGLGLVATSIENVEFELERLTM